MKTAIIQLKVKPDKFANIARAEELMTKAVKNDAKLIVLPEMFNCPYGTQYFKEYSEPIPTGPTCQRLSSFAKKNRVTVVGGSIPEVSNGKLYNTSAVFNPSGNLIAKHRKVHLFDVSLKKVKMKESSVLTPGESLTTFSTPFGKVGLIICYDVRFPEIFRQMLKKDIRAVVVPAAFSVVTGSAHWKMLMRTRAVDNQIYMVAASPARSYGKGYRAYGHSLVSDPFGVVIAEAGVGEEVIYADLNNDRVEEVRNTLPLLRHRKFQC